MSARRLNSRRLAGLAAIVRRPDYDREARETGIVHIGVGAFYKAHQAVYTDTAMAIAGGHWMTMGVSLKSRIAHDELASQDGLFTVVEQENASETLRVVGSLRGILVAPDNPEDVITLMARPSVHVVTLTITEKGYCLSPSSGQLDLSHPDIVQDLATPDRPVSAIGYLAAAIRRRSAIEAPLTVMSCDNLASNGEKLRRAVRIFLERSQPDILDWFERQVCFPNSMVDRIVPATTPDMKQRVARILGVQDEACVATETFSQWVIEDRFAGPVPDWVAAGALVVGDVSPYETLKLRLLNAAHSAIAYLGMIGNIKYVHEVIGRPDFRTFIDTMMREELQRTVYSPAGFDVEQYVSQLLKRFSNPTLRHETAQIAADGSQKLPNRILPSLRNLRRTSAPHPALTLVVAAWIQYISGEDLEGRPIDVRDPTIANLRTGLSKAATTASLVNTALAHEPVFGKDLLDEEDFVASLTHTLEQLRRTGLVETLRQVAARVPANFHRT